MSSLTFKRPWEKVPISTPSNGNLSHGPASHQFNAGLSIAANSAVPHLDRPELKSPTSITPVRRKRGVSRRANPPRVPSNAGVPTCPPYIINSLNSNSTLPPQIGAYFNVPRDCFNVPGEYFTISFSQLM